MPGLLRGVARTAIVAGTATSVSNRVSRRQSQRWAAQEQQQAPAPLANPAPQYATPPQYAPPSAAPSAQGVDRIGALRDLGELRAQGVLTDAEFEAEKAKILAS
ncbi:MULTISPECIES: SHOCT domain-containing protein [Actinomycetes]|uniref:SHOCT domain-containing protein n=1 Tax=Actinomycetes TaxID=1760 RepID=UPI0004C04D52|nr:MULTISPECIES: SHOCT domain-containing protein [Actinomycetes]